jgi:hypothetical protein
MGAAHARSPLLRACAGCAFGFLLGVAAWGEGRAPVLALALPLPVAFSRTRLQAFCVAAAYAIATARYGASFVASWFDNGLAIGIAAILVYGVATGCVWAIGWSASPRVTVRVLAMTGAWLLALAAGIAVPGHPVIGAGYVLPGAGWCGVAIALALPGVALCIVGRIPTATLRRNLAASVLAALAAAGVFLGNLRPTADPVRGIHPERTQWGRLDGRDDALTRMQRMGAALQGKQVASVLWPESIIGRYDPATYAVLDLELLQDARRAGRTQVVGMDIAAPGDRLFNAAVAFYPDGRTATAVARQPAPFSLWKPWRHAGTFVADWRAHNMLALGQGDNAAVVFCYEEYVPVLYLLNEALDAPTVYVALTNTWAAPSSAAAAIQTWHSLGMARLFGRPYLKAENRPRT